MKRLFMMIIFFMFSCSGCGLTSPSTAVQTSEPSSVPEVTLAAELQETTQDPTNGTVCPNGTEVPVEFKEIKEDQIETVILKIYIGGNLEEDCYSEKMNDEFTFSKENQILMAKVVERIRFLETYKSPDMLEIKMNVDFLIQYEDGTSDLRQYRVRPAYKLLESIIGKEALEEKVKDFTE